MQNFCYLNGTKPEFNYVLLSSYSVSNMHVVSASFYARVESSVGMCQVNAKQKHPRCRKSEAKSEALASY